MADIQYNDKMRAYYRLPKDVKNHFLADSFFRKAKNLVKIKQDIMLLIFPTSSGYHTLLVTRRNCVMLDGTINTMRKNTKKIDRTF